jgi:hypothetical protein
MLTHMLSQTEEVGQLTVNMIAFLTIFAFIASYHALYYYMVCIFFSKTVRELIRMFISELGPRSNGKLPDGFTRALCYGFQSFRTSLLELGYLFL